MTYNSAFDTLASVTDPDGNTTTITTNNQGETSAITDAVGNALLYGYDTQGNLTQTTDRDGQTTDLTYNSAGQATHIAYADGSFDDYTYDSQGDVLTATDASGTTNMTYDSAGRLTEITYPTGLFLKYTYDAQGRRTQMTDGTVTENYLYDDEGRLSEVTDGTGALIVKYTYDPAGDVVRKDNGNGTFTAYGLDADGNVLTIVNHGADGSVNSEYDYTYDSLGHVLTMTTAGQTTVYGYDKAGQLTSVMLPGGGSISYQYDAAGNRTGEIDNGVTTAYTTSELNEYSSIGGTAQTYDADGALTASVNGTYTYDAQHRLVGVTTPTDTWTYEYDALGNRIAETHNGQKTVFLVDPSGLGNVVGEYDSNGNLMASYTYGLGLASQIDAGGQADYYDFDVTGSTIGLTDPGGAYAQRYSYLPFGQIQSSVGSVPTPFQFNGASGVSTDGSGLSYMRARYYSPSQGRFVNQDPNNVNGGTNLYTYAGNDPINASDPTGLSKDYTGFLGEGIALQGGVIVDDNGGYHIQFGVGLGVGASLGVKESDSSGETDTFGDFSIKASAGTSIPGTPVSAEGALDVNLTQSKAKASAAADLLFVKPTAEYELMKRKGAVKFPRSDNLKKIFIDSLQGKFLSKSFKAKLALMFVYTSDPINKVTKTKLVGPVDPNFISGPAGFGTQNYIPSGQALPYVIGFENEPDASAPAQVVEVTQQLDADLDWSTFQLGSFGFDGQVYSVPAELTSYDTRIDATSSLGVYVDVSASFNELTGALTWTFTSLDPTTLDVPLGNPEEGFLPPDATSPEGEGWISYTVQPKQASPSGTAINAKASVIFNAGLSDQSSLDTAPYANTIDASAPTSNVTALSAFSPANFIVAWTGQDDTGGSGIATYNVYVSDDNGPFTLWQSATTQTSATFTGQDKHTYAFYSVATDNVGNVQQTPTSAQATTEVDAIAPTSSVAALPAFSPGSFTLRWSGSDSTGGSGLASYSIYVSDNDGAYTPFLTNTTQTSATFTGQDGHSYAFYSIATDVAGNVEDAPTSAQATTRVDAAPPNSSVSALPTYETSTGFLLQWSGADTSGGSGLASYTIFVSDNGGSFVPFLNNTTLTSATFAGADGHTYGFYSVAVDNVGNVQPTPSAAQATTTVNTDLPSSSVAALPAFENSTSFLVQWAALPSSDSSAVTSYSIFVSDDGNSFQPFLTNTTQTSATFTGQDGHTYGFYSIATDVAGNVQPTPGSAQATTQVDTTTPTSSVAALPIYSRPGFTLSWSGQDNQGGSGIASYDVYLSDDGGPFSSFLLATAQTSTTFPGVDGHSYAFYTLAHDRAGNTQTAPGPVQSTTVRAAADHLVVHAPSQAIVGGQFTATIQAEDASNLVDPLFTGSVALLLNSSSTTARLSGVQTAILQNGVATFSNLSINVPGNWSLLAAGSGDLPGNAAIINVVPAPQFSVRLAPVTPGNSGAGQPFNVTITALLNGKPDIGYLGTIQIASGDPQVAPSTYTFVPGDDGSKILSITLETPGKQTVIVDDVSLPSRKGTSNAVTVTGTLPTSVDHFTLSGFPTTDVTGTAHAFTITAVSAAGKTVTNYTGTVQITSSDAAFAPFDVHFIASSKGVVKTTATLTTLGNQSLTATDGSGITGTESNITVVSPATRLGIAESSTRITAGGQVTVTVTGLTASKQTDSLFADTLVLATSDPHAQVVAQPIAGGVQTFTVTLTTAEIQTITLTDLTRPTIRGSVPSVSVTAAAVSHLSVTGFPLFAVAGLSQHFTVSAEDKYGNPALSGFTDTIQVAGMSFPFASSYHGTHVFTTTMTTTGPQSLTATDITDPQVHSGTEGNIIIVNASTAMITDPSNSNETALVIIAPAGGGTIVITPSDATGMVLAVSINGKVVKSGPFAPTGHIIVYGQGGNDVVQEVPATFNGKTVQVAVPAVVLGGTGTNTVSLVGSSASNVVVGGAGKDSLTGGSGDDVLIGGGGADVLKAGSGDDVLIGGSTIYDGNLTALMGLMTEWGQSGASFASRVQGLFGNGSGAVDPFPLDPQTVLRDTAINQLVGGSGTDWFWLSLNAKTADRISGDANDGVITGEMMG